MAAHMRGVGHGMDPAGRGPQMGRRRQGDWIGAGTAGRSIGAGAITGLPQPLRVMKLMIRTKVREMKDFMGFLLWLKGAAVDDGQKAPVLDRQHDVIEEADGQGFERACQRYGQGVVLWRGLKISARVVMPYNYAGGAQ